MKKILFLLSTVLLINRTVTAQHSDDLVVKTDKILGVVQPTMWGIFFEDINMGADGGIYAELVKNRSFEFFKPLMGWTVSGNKLKEGDVLVVNRRELNEANKRYLQVIAHAAGAGDLYMVNEGFRGMGIKENMEYHFSVMYKQAVGIKIHVGLIDSSGKKLSEESVLSPRQTKGEWVKDSVQITANTSALKGKLMIWFEGSGSIDLDMISLFPSDTWKNRPGGMRADMIQLLADMKPGFMRFPGGCIVEGFDLTQRYQWKKTIGPVENRMLAINRWNFELPKRQAPDYFQTFGLGFFEYFQIAEDIGAEPLPILNCGMACQFNSGEVVEINQLDPYLQDALDLIEFANGPVTSTWGKVRASLGHPAPFHLKMMGIGNENWGPQYVERLKLFMKAIKSKYPEFKIVASSGTDPNGERFNYLNKELRDMHADIIDEHYYRRPEWFFANAKRYDNYPRNGAKIFCGEYAAQSVKTVSVDNKNNWLTALSEAAFMTGLERNADVVCMASYAPLFAHTDGWQWTPDLIWVNNLQSYGTSDYYVQKLYALNKGTNTLSITLNNDVIAGQDSLYASAAMDSATHDLIIKLVNASDKKQTKTIALTGAKKLVGEPRLTVLKSDYLFSENSFSSPDKIAPSESTIPVDGKKIKFVVAPYSFNVLRIKMQ